MSNPTLPLRSVSALRPLLAAALLFTAFGCAPVGDAGALEDPAAPSVEALSAPGGDACPGATLAPVDNVIALVTQARDLAQLDLTTPLPAASGMVTANRDALNNTLTKLQSIRAFMVATTPTVTTPPEGYQIHVAFEGLLPNLVAARLPAVIAAALNSPAVSGVRPPTNHERASYELTSRAIEAANEVSIHAARCYVDVYYL